ncbi:MAG: type II secretion system F family protein [Chloroflexi bacterium]|nr:MAG: type II secretion system F family protein [Chloroflexota bacterium]
MTLGAFCLALACFAGLQAIFNTRRPLHSSDAALIRASTLSPVEWRMRQQTAQTWYQRWLRPIVMLWGSRLHLRPSRIDPMYLVQAGLDPEQIDGVEFRMIRVLTALAGLATAGLLAVVTSGSVALIPLFGWAGYIAPARILAARRHRHQTALHRELPELVSLIRAFTTAGMPLERSLHVLSAKPGDGGLRREIRLALGRYGLGLSIEQALQEIGPRTGLDDVTTFVAALAQCKRIGTGLDATLRDQELMVRLNQRNRATAQAAAVGTKLLVVLGGIYLPEFVILIMIPLFWGIMQRAFG